MLHAFTALVYLEEPNPLRQMIDESFGCANVYKDCQSNWSVALEKNSQDHFPQHQALGHIFLMLHSGIVELMSKYSVLLNLLFVVERLGL